MLIIKVKINGYQNKLVKEFEYLGEILIHSHNEKRNWIEKTK